MHNHNSQIIQIHILACGCCKALHLCMMHCSAETAKRIWACLTTHEINMVGAWFVWAAGSDSCLDPVSGLCGLCSVVQRWSKFQKWCYIKEVTWFAFFFDVVLKRKDRKKEYVLMMAWIPFNNQVESVKIVDLDIIFYPSTTDSWNLAAWCHSDEWTRLWSVNNCPQKWSIELNLFKLSRSIIDP